MGKHELKNLNNKNTKRKNYYSNMGHERIKNRQFLDFFTKVVVPNKMLLINHVQWLRFLVGHTRS